MSLNSSTYLNKKKQASIQSQSAINKSLKSSPLIIENIPLSRALAENATAFDGDKISLVQKLIDKIDAIPRNYTNIETLYLSNNCLRSLAGIQQFSKLKNLSVAQNEINDEYTFDILSQLYSIEVLNMSGNPICKTQNYKESVIKALPNLKMLDGKPINAEDKSNNEVNIRTKNNLQNILLQNYCELIKLNSFSKKIEIHKELMMKNPKFVNNFTFVDLQIFKKLYHYMNYQDNKYLDILKTNLMKDVNTLRKELGLRNGDNEAGFGELVVRQQQKISELSIKIEEQIKQLVRLASKIPINKKAKNVELNLEKSVFSKMSSGAWQVQPDSMGRTLPANLLSPKLIEKDSLNSHNNSAHASNYLSTRIAPSKTTPVTNFLMADQDLYQKIFCSPNNTNDQPLKAEELDNLLMVDKGMANLSKTQNEKFHDDQNSDFAQQRRKLSRSPKQSEDMPKPIKLETKPSSHADECCRNIHKKAKKLMESGQYNNVIRHKSPMKLQIEEKEKHIEELSEQLKKKNNELYIINDTNQHLQDKIEEYYNQSQMTSKLAKEEVEVLRFRLEKSNDLQRNLEHEIEKLNQKLNEVLLRNYELEKNNQNLQETEQKANDYAKELEQYAYSENNNQLADKFREKSLMRYGLHSLLHAIIKKKKIDRFQLSRNTNSFSNYLKLCFNSWIKYFMKRKYLRIKQKRLDNAILIKWFKKWKKIPLKIKTLKLIIQEKNENLMKFVFVCWKRYLALRWNKKSKYQKVGIHYNRKLAKNSILGLKLLYKRFHCSLLEEKQLAKKAEKFHDFKLKSKKFKGWANWLLLKRRTSKINKHKAYCFRRYILAKLGFGVLIGFCKMMDKINHFLELKAIRRNNELKNKYFTLWNIDYVSLCKKHRIQKALKTKYVLNRLMQKWKESLALVKNGKIQMKEAIASHQQNLKQKVIMGLSMMRKKVKNIKIMSKVFTTKLNSKCQSKYFLHWMQNFVNKVRSKEENFKKKIEIEGRYFKVWLIYHQKAHKKRLNYRAMEKYLITCNKNKLLNVMTKWRQFTRSKIRNLGILEYMGQRKIIDIYRKVFYVMINDVNKSLKRNISKATNKTAILEANIKSSVIYMNNIDEEKIELVEKVKAYNAQLIDRDNEIIQKNQEIQSLKATLSQKEEKEIILLQKIQAKDKEINDMKHKVNDNMNDNQQIFDKYENVISTLRQEKDELLIKINDLKQELNNKEGTLAHTENILIEKSMNAADILKVAEIKLTNSIKATNEYKNALNDRDKEFMVLRERIMNMKLETDHYKTKLHDTIEILFDNRLIYEKRIKELDDLVEKLTLEINQVKDNNVKYQRQIKELKLELKRNETELGLLNRTQSHKGINLDDKIFAERKKIREDLFNQIDDKIKVPELTQEILKNDIQSRRNFERKQDQIKSKIEELQEYLNALQIDFNYKANSKENTFTKSLLTATAATANRHKNPVDIIIPDSPKKSILKNISPIAHKSYVTDAYKTYILDDVNDSDLSYGYLKRVDSNTKLPRNNSAYGYHSPEKINHGRNIGNELYNMQNNPKTNVANTNNNNNNNTTMTTTHGISKTMKRLDIQKGDNKASNIKKNSINDEADISRKLRNQVKESIEQRIKQLNTNPVSDTSRAKLF